MTIEIVILNVIRRAFLTSFLPLFTVRENFSRNEPLFMNEYEDSNHRLPIPKAYRTDTHSLTKTYSHIYGDYWSLKSTGRKYFQIIFIT